MIFYCAFHIPIMRGPTCGEMLVGAVTKFKNFVLNIILWPQ